MEIEQFHKNELIRIGLTYQKNSAIMDENDGAKKRDQDYKEVLSAK